jgi:hypothetical protein
MSGLDDAKPKEAVMSVAMFAGSFIGTLLGFAVQNRTLAVCKYLFGKHPILAKSIGLMVVLVLVLIPYMALSGIISISAIPFFWGACFTFSLLICFTLTILMTGQPLQGS